MPAYAV
jgi:hypothetical protein